MLTLVADWFTYVLLRMPQGTVLSSAVQFFVYDIIKIYLLLAGVIFAVGLLQTWLPPETIKGVLARHSRLMSHVLASLMGAVAPFCSCSAVPMFIGFVESGVPLGVTMTFLIASPMITPSGVALLWGLFGARIAILYVAFGLVISIVSGLVIGHLHLERWVEDYVYQTKVGEQSATTLSLQERLRAGWNYVREIFRRVAPWVAAGVAIGAFIHGYAPADLLVRYAGRDNPLAVLVAVLIGIPLYSNAEGVIPIVQALWAKGLPLGTALAFMMAVTGLSLPESLILRRVLKPKLLATFIGIVGVSIIIVGYLFNAVM
ncbi:MAG TPA: permease [Candidatus Cryosericum sp.]|nr:permease [Candidatus Cryosericum sp.]